jgi:group I intron endonuclease
MITIYKITNTVTNKVYIGQTKQSITRRLKQHLYDSKRTDTKLSRSIRKYGIDSFKIEVIVSGEFNRDFSDELERHYIQLFSSTVDTCGYNIKPGGNSVPMSQETKYKISLKLRGMKMPIRCHYSDVDRYGLNKAEEVKLKRSLTHVGALNPKSVKVKIVEIDKTFDTIKDAAAFLNIHWKTLSRRLRGKSLSRHRNFSSNGCEVKVELSGTTYTLQKV